MKKGKSCVLKGYKNLKCSYGTVDAKNLKSIYLNIQSWVEPKEYYEDWSKQVSYFTKVVKNLLSEIIDKFIFESKYIVDMDLRTSGIALNKRSFMNLEITFFIKEKVDFKSIRLKNSIKDIIKIIQKEAFESSKLFDFYLTKNDDKVKMNIV
jgi:hypothetical protein